MNQIEKADYFASLHVPGQPLVLYNIWDGGGARAVAAAGARAVATGSWSVAAAHGYEDGEKVPFDLVQAIVGRIVAATDLPVSVDVERGYADNPKAVADNVTRLIRLGIAGINIEDSKADNAGLYDVDAQCARIRATCDRATDMGVRLFVNARTDLFLGVPRDEHHARLERAKERASAYAEAGARGFFAPGIVDEQLIAELCNASPLPVNVMVTGETPPTARLAELGVARISYGPLPYVAGMRQLQEDARAAMTA